MESPEKLTGTNSLVLTQLVSSSPGLHLTDRSKVSLNLDGASSRYRHNLDEQHFGASTLQNF